MLTSPELMRVPCTSDKGKRCIMNEMWLSLSSGIPDISTSTSNWRESAARVSRSPQGTTCAHVQVRRAQDLVQKAGAVVGQPQLGGVTGLVAMAYPETELPHSHHLQRLGLSSGRAKNTPSRQRSTLSCPGSSRRRTPRAPREGLCICF